MDRLHENRIYTGTVESYSSEGLRIVRLDGAVVFVPQAVRGNYRPENQGDEDRRRRGDREDPQAPLPTGPSLSAPITAGAAGATSST